MAHFIAFKKNQTEDFSQEAYYWILQVTGLKKISLHELQPKLYFSLSHTHGLMGFALSEKILGLDIEKKQRLVSDKVQIYMQHPDDEIFGLEAWCIKEAAYKAFSYYEERLALKDIFVNKNEVRSFYHRATYNKIPHEEYFIYLVENVIPYKSV